MRYLTLLLVTCALAAAATTACGDSTGLQAYLTNAVDTVSVYALSGTPISAPSGYSIQAGHAVRTDQPVTFDFAFDIDATGQSLLLPTGALKLGSQSGLQISSLAFDSIKIAPTGGYQLDSAVAVQVNSVVIMHSAPLVCPTGLTGVLYAKLHVLKIDMAPADSNGRRLDFEILADLNCGYRGLEPGLPHH